MKIHPVFIMTAPVVVLVASVQFAASNPPVRPTDQPIQQSTSAPAADPDAGRKLFLRNCAHCHGADAHGDDGPDLHDIGWTDDQIANRIRKGKAGQMTSFAGKLKPEEINALVAYVQSLK
ncbi:MAG TPA: cytochrome c [Candidatus Acidoferrum sp.]|nr:cytochrome c [Candidatus Acidoferrum sp.]